jgi:peptidoglycan/xylan/chitin deacetylase (PgdA/CDA1 family)
VTAVDAAHKPVILAYHSIADGSPPLEIPPQIFAEQMEWLKANARVVPLGDVVTALVNHTSIPERAIALTFDDGFRDFYSAAAPVLLRLQFPTTVFLATAHVGGKNNWAGQPSWVAPQPLMGWAEIRELAQKGIHFSSHSVTHPDLTRVPATQLTSELEASKKEIESQTGHAAEFFGYPYGRWNGEVRAAVKKVYRGACSTGAGVVEPDADPFALPRVDAHYVRSMERFRTLFTDGFVRYVTVRRWIRRLRGQPEGQYARVN